MSKEIFPSPTNPPLQLALQPHPSNDQFKRRRVTRACDECRKKKVKCDGQQPCIHCTVYSYNCTYNKPTKRTFTQKQQDSIVNNTATTSSSSTTTTTTTTANNNNITNYSSTSNINSPVTPTTVNATLSTIPNTNVINLNTNLTNIQNLSNDTNINPNSVDSMGTFNLISPSTVMFKSNAQNSTSINNNNNNKNTSDDNGSNIVNSSSSTTTTTSTGKIKRKSNSTTLKLQSQINKYQQIFNTLLPNMPDIDTIDIPLFSQILRNFKDNSDTFLDDATKEYYMIINDTIPATNTTSNKLTSPSYQTSNSDNLLISNSNNNTSNDDDNNNSINIKNNNKKNSSISLVDSMMMNPNDSNKSIQYCSPPPLLQSIGREIKIILPPKPVALLFVKNTWEHCCVLLRFYHRPSFLKQLDELYKTDPNNYTVEQMKFLPLCYAIMAVGALFTKSIEQYNNNNSNTNNNSNNKVGNVTTVINNNNIVFMDSNNNIIKEVPSVNTHCKESPTVNKNSFMQDEGYKYFIAARKLLDITNTRDLNSIQAVLTLFIFLQCSARLSTCYSYIGVAMRSVLREGFHRKVPNHSPLSLIEIECRKRLFFTIYKLDIYVNAMLGLPRSISPEDWDQTLPFDISDDNITDDKIYFERQNNVLSSAGIANYHTKLLFILDAIMRELYPIKKTNNIISHETVTQLEIKLKNWVDTLPMELKPNAKTIPPKYERANKLLHLSFLHVQIILYRPFIHFLSRNFVSSNTDKLSLQRANNSIVVARTVVRMAQDMVNKNLISGSYWYACYTIFYSVAGLLFYIHEADLPDKDSARKYYEILKDAECGRNVLIQLKDTSMAANRTYNILNKLFEKLNSKTIQLSAKYNSSFNRKPPLNETFSTASSDVSQTSSYNMDKFVKDVPIFSDYFDQSISSDVAKNIRTPPTNSVKKFGNGNSDLMTDNNVSNKNNDYNDSNRFKATDNRTTVDNVVDFFVKTAPKNSNIMSGPSTHEDQFFDFKHSYTKDPVVNSLKTDAVSQHTLERPLPIPANFDNNNNNIPIDNIDSNKANAGSVKSESLSDDNVGIFDVFDKLDAQLFGKDNVASQYQNPAIFNFDQS